MGFSPLANMSLRMPHGNRQSARGQKPVGFTIHHQAAVDSKAGTNPSREVSANYWIQNDGTIIPQIDENYRAWTTGAVGYPAGALSDFRNITAEVSNTPDGVKNETWKISDAALKSLIALIADVHERHGMGAVTRSKSRSVAVHQDFVPTACPGPHIMGNLNMIIAEAEKIRAKGGTPAPKPVNPPAPAPAKGKSVAQLANEVQAGIHGNGHEARRKSMGVSQATYDKVRAEVNRRLYGGSGATPAPVPSTSISAMASQVLAGKHGTGHANRQKSLGVSNAVYQQVRDEVNRRVGVAPVKAPVRPAGKSIATMATEVIAGKHGNGHANRQRSLGVNAGTYAQVRAEVNRRV